MSRASNLLQRFEEHQTKSSSPTSRHPKGPHKIVVDVNKVALGTVALGSGLGILGALDVIKHHPHIISPH